VLFRASARADTTTQSWGLFHVVDSSRMQLLAKPLQSRQIAATRARVLHRTGLRTQPDKHAPGTADAARGRPPR
jgi:hypothetical protein